MVLLLLGCDCEDGLVMFSQNSMFVLIILNVTNEQERALGHSQER